MFLSWSFTVLLISLDLLKSSAAANIPRSDTGQNITLLDTFPISTANITSFDNPPGWNVSVSVSPSPSPPPPPIAPWRLQKWLDISIQRTIGTRISMPDGSYPRVLGLLIVSIEAHDMTAGAVSIDDMSPTRIYFATERFGVHYNSIAFIFHYNPVVQNPELVNISPWHSLLDPLPWPPQLSFPEAVQHVRDFYHQSVPLYSAYLDAGRYVPRAQQQRPGSCWDLEVPSLKRRRRVNCKVYMDPYDLLCDGAAAMNQTGSIDDASAGNQTGSIDDASAGNQTGGIDDASAGNQTMETTSTAIVGVTSGNIATS